MLRFGKSKYFIAAGCEFFANVFFSFMGSLVLSTALGRTPPDVVLAGWGNGVALALVSAYVVDTFLAFTLCCHIRSRRTPAETSALVAVPLVFEYRSR